MLKIMSTTKSKNNSVKSKNNSVTNKKVQQNESLISKDRNYKQDSEYGTNEEKQKRVAKIINDNENDPARINLELVKEGSFYRLSPFEEFLILNMDNSSKIIQAVIMKVKKPFDPVFDSPDLPKALPTSVKGYEKEIADELYDASLRFKQYGEVLDTTLENFSTPEIRQILDSKPYVINGKIIAAVAGYLRTTSERVYGFTTFPDDDPEAKRSNLFSLNRVKQFLPTLPDDSSRYLYLLKIRTLFQEDTAQSNLQKNYRYKLRRDRDFLKMLELQIELFKEISKMSPNTSNKEDQESEKEIHGLSSTQQVLAILYFLKFNGVKSIDKTRIARLVAVLRKGKNFKAVYDKVRDEDTLLITNNGDDARMIARLYESVGEPQITKMIENDLEGWAIKPKRRENL